MKKNKKTLIAAIPLFLIVILVFAGFGVWKKVQRYFDAEPGGTDAPDNQNPE